MELRNLPSPTFVGPGCGFLPDQPVKLMAVVGSGIVLTIYDSYRKVGGMTHFYKPYREQGKPSTAIYAAPAIISLIDMMVQNGSKIKDLKAQFYGGAFKMDNPKFNSFKNIHNINVQVSCELLQKKKVAITGIDVGGSQGRKIGFNTATGETVIYKVNKIRDADWYPKLTI